MTRYAHLFAAPRPDGLVVPFLMLGDPDASATLAAARALVHAGADALELGIPFSDPVADGPIIQRASARAIGAGATPDRCFEIIRELRRESPELPLGLLVYANAVVVRGLSAFYRSAATAGADSVLVADVPAVEAGPFAAAAREAGIEPVAVVPPTARPDLIARAAALGGPFVYLQGRPGVTGVTVPMRPPDPAVIAALARAGAPPALVGFGVSERIHLESALAAGARGVIVGSAVVRLVERYGTRRNCLAAELRALMGRLRGAGVAQRTVQPVPTSQLPEGSVEHGRIVPKA